MKKKLLFVGGIVAVVVVFAGLYLRYIMGRAMYSPGNVAAAANLDPPPQSADARFWEVERGVRLAHFADGAGRPVLVVHGGPGYPIETPPPGLKLLGEKHQFHYYDQRGCGNSTRPLNRFASRNYYANLKELERMLGLGAQVADIERIRRLLGQDKLVLLGHSFGGLLASLYAAEFPERVKGLVLVAPADLLMMPTANGDLFATVRGRLPEAMQAEYAAFLGRYFDYRNIFSKSESDLVALNAELARYYAAATRTRTAPPEQGINGGWMVHAMYFSMGRRHDWRAAMRRVTAPVLVLHGADDLQPEAASRTCAGAFPNARFKVIPKAGHFMFSDQPAEFAAAVGKFLGEL